MAQTAFSKTFFGPFFFGTPVSPAFPTPSNAGNLLLHVQEAVLIPGGPCQGQLPQRA
jgi:hypothetical protein